MTKPAVFIGSSSEGLKVARAVKSHLQSYATVTIWDEGVVKLSQGTLEALVDSLHQFDFAIFVLSADDLTVSRGITSISPRDNVLFELGLFMGRNGRLKTFVVRSKEKDLKVLTDFLGVTVARYESPLNADSLSEDEWKPYLKECCEVIKIQIQEEFGKLNDAFDSKLIESLTNRLVFLLRHIEREEEYVSSKKLAEVMFDYNSNAIKPRFLLSLYKPMFNTIFRVSAVEACRYLYALDLVEIHKVSGMFKITQRGIRLINHPKLRDTYKTGYSRKLIDI